MILFPQLNSRARHGNIDYGNILWEQNVGPRGPSSTRRGMFLKRTFAGDLQGRPEGCPPTSRSVFATASPTVSRGKCYERGAKTATLPRAPGWSMFLIRPI